MCRLLSNTAYTLPHHWWLATLKETEDGHFMLYVSCLPIGKCKSNITNRITQTFPHVYADVKSNPFESRFLTGSSIDQFVNQGQGCKIDWILLLIDYVNRMCMVCCLKFVIGDAAKWIGQMIIICSAKWS
jgi:hypothetical protein